MLFIYPTPQYPRRPLEYVFKFLYLIATMIHVISLVVLITDFYTRLQSSMIDYFTSSTFTISSNLEMVMRNCTYASKVTLNGVTAEVVVNADSISYGLLTTAQSVIALFVVEFLLIVNNGIASMNYSKGNRHLRLFGIHIPFYHITVVFTYIYLIAMIVITWVFQSNRIFYRNAIRHCADQLYETDPTVLLDAEYDDINIFTTAVYWPFGATCFSLLVYFAAAAVLCWFSEDEATLLLSEADAPWEKRGVLCNTYKPLLKIHTAQRNGIIEDARNAIQDGQKVRIVRSYQLMTEEDFEVLVKAMREQVMQALKEKQFEKLKENFGERESQIDEGGLQWRQAMPWKLKDGEGSPDELEDAFTDNDMRPYTNDNYNNNNNNNYPPEEMYPLEELGLNEEDFEDLVDDNNNNNNNYNNNNNRRNNPYDNDMMDNDDYNNNNNVIYDEDGEPIVIQEEPGYNNDDDDGDVFFNGGRGDYPDDDYNDDYNNNNNNNNVRYEPSPISPVGDEYSPTEGWSGSRGGRNNRGDNNDYDNMNNFNGNSRNNRGGYRGSRNNRNNNNNRGNGNYEDMDYADGDEMSFDGF